MTSEQDLLRRRVEQRVELGLAPPSAPHPSPAASKSVELLRLAEQCEQQGESVMLSMGGACFWANARMLRFVSALVSTLEHRSGEAS
jgi:hypothetical protein